MAQTPAIHESAVGTIDYTPGANVIAGQVVLVGTIPMIAPLAILSGVKGSLVYDGVWKVPQVAAVLTAGDAVYWDENGSPVTGDGSSGCATGTSTSNNLMGLAAYTTADDDDYAYVLLTAAKRTTAIAGNVTADDITASDATLAIAGLDAAQGGLVSVTGGDSATAGNAGGAASVVGGVGGATGVGGAVAVTGGVSGTTSGTGGGVTIAAGAAGSSAGNAAGGAAAFSGGLGKGTGVGGAVAVTGGVSGSGATGAGGAVAIAGGAAASTDAIGGAGSLTGGIGKGTEVGGAVSQVGGVGGATGAGGAVAVTGGAGGSSSGTGGAVVIAAGAGIAGNASGGALTLRGGAKHSAGTAGAIVIGDSNTASITCGVMPRIPTATVAAANSAQNNGTSVVEGFTRVTAADGTKAVVLPSAVAGMVVELANDVDNVLKVFPADSDSINQAAGDAVYNQTNYAFRRYVAYDATEWYTDPETIA